MDESSGCLHTGPPRKCRILDVPYQAERIKKREQWLLQLRTALQEIDKLLKSARTKFIGGTSGLQARRTRAIRAHLDLVAHNGCLFVDAAEHAAEANGFSRSWGGRQLCTSGNHF